MYLNQCFSDPKDSFHSCPYHSLPLRLLIGCSSLLVWTALWEKTRPDSTQELEAELQKLPPREELKHELEVRTSRGARDSLCESDKLF